MVQAGSDLGAGLTCPACSVGTLILKIRYAVGSALLKCDHCGASYVAGLMRIK